MNFIPLSINITDAGARFTAPLQDITVIQYNFSLQHNLKILIGNIPIKPIQQSIDDFLYHQRAAGISDDGRQRAAVSVHHGETRADEGDVFGARNLLAVGRADHHVNALVLNPLVELEQVGGGLSYAIFRVVLLEEGGNLAVELLEINKFSPYFYCP
jgi:hypothetical protein